MYQKIDGWFEVKTETGEFDIHAAVRFIGKDILAALWGGKKHHIGAVSAAHPRPSLKDKNITSSTSSVICFSGHKEDFLTKKISEQLAASLNTNVVVTAGMHWDNITSKGIEKVTANSEIIVKLIMKHLKNCKVNAFEV